VRLLFLTQVLDRQHGVLGFVVRWIAEFAKHTDAVRVVALEVGDTAGLPDNVDWIEIGRKGRVGRYFKYRSTLHQAMGEDGFDAVLSHMVPRYALMAAGPARKHGARPYLWYTHKGVDSRLRRAVPMVLKTFTASAESLRLDAPNRMVTGHGIDTNHFDLDAPTFTSPYRILSVGRLTPAKDPLCVLRGVRRLLDAGHEVALDWVGGGLTKSDEGFSQKVQREIEQLDLVGCVFLHGEVPYAEVDRFFQSADFLVNASHTGSVDKVVLEAMAARRPAISCNDSFPVIFDALPESTGRSASFQFAAGDDKALAERIAALIARGPAQLTALGEQLRGLVVLNHGVESLCERLIREMEPGA
jgi:glycosyltransferase involved in cell wall biosynthesis